MEVQLIDALKSITAQPEDETAASVFSQLIAFWMKKIPEEDMMEYQIKVLEFTKKFIADKDANF